MEGHYLLTIKIFLLPSTTMSQMLLRNKRNLNKGMKIRSLRRKQMLRSIKIYLLEKKWMKMLISIDTQIIFRTVKLNSCLL